MKNNKLFMLGCALLMGVSSLGFTGCTSNDEPSKDIDVELTTPSNPSSEEDKPEKAERKAMSTYFQGVKIIGDKDIDFDALLNRQIDVLAQDITHRLHVVYGKKTRDGNNFDLKDNYLRTDGGNFIHDSEEHKAVVDYKRLLTDEEVDMSVKENYNFAIDDMKAYQKSLLMYVNPGSYHPESYDDLGSDHALNLVGAIYGDNAGIKDNGGMIPVLCGVESEGWLIQDRAIMKGALFNKIKELLGSDVKRLGFYETFNDDLASYIYSNIIGDTLVSKDNKYGEDWASRGGITTEYIIELNKGYTGPMFEVFTDHARLYKGYKPVITAIISQALNNKFVGEEVSIYPVFSKIGVKTQATYAINNVNEETEIVLMPNKTTPVSKIWFKTNAKTANQTVKITVEVANGGSELKKITKTINADKEYELNLTGMKTTSVGKFNGVKENSEAIDIFANNDVTEINNGNNYIKVIFENVISEFGITFTGINSAR